MRIYRTFVCVLLVFIMGFALCACDSVSEDDTAVSAVPSQTGDEGSADPEKGTPGELDYSEGSQILIMTNPEAYEARPHGIQPGTVLNYLAGRGIASDELIPWKSYHEGWLSGNIYEGLLYMYMNDPEDIRGCIAESWAHSDDYLTWTFQIRDGVTFTDGTACDAYAIEKSWDYAQKTDAYNFIFRPYHIASWEAVSEKEFVIHMSAPCAYLEVALCGNSPLLIASPTAMEVHGVSSRKAAVGTGPYSIASYDERTYVLKAYEGYHLEEKMPCIETVNLKIMYYRSDVLEALLSGELDGAVMNTTNRFGIGNITSFNEVESYHYLLDNGYGGTIVSCFDEGLPMWFNANNVEAFKTFEVREAMCRFIDFKAIDDRIYEGMGYVQDSLWAAGTLGYVPTDQFYCDPDEGQALLASVGMEASQIRVRDSYPDTQADLAIEIQNALSTAGVEADFEVFGLEASFTPFGSGRWQIIFTTGGYENTSPYRPWAFYLKADAHMRLCWQDIYDPELYQKMQDECDAMTSAATWDDMLTHCMQLTVYQQDNFGAIGSVQSPVFLALGKDFKNSIYFNVGYPQETCLQLYYLYQ